MTAVVIPDVLRKAAAVIEQHGWHRGSDVAFDGSGVCANGALRLALGHGIVQGETTCNIFPPLNWTADDFADYKRGIIGAGEAIHGYMDTAERFGGPAGPLPGGQFLGLPRFVEFNDRIAQDAGQVTQLFRDTADWLEAHPLAEVARVEDLPAPTTDPSTPNRELVLA